ncbi:hypothetical protein MP638_005598 [Amoeboaphelidium occidentale]|nr:hypothetical protein MP638_005598 [Amoeboaphelidium occidentale]
MSNNMHVPDESVDEELQWVLRKKESRRKKGDVVQPDTKYTARKRKPRF